MPVDGQIALGKLLRQLHLARKAAGLSMTEVGRRMGVHSSVISELEHGQKHDPTVATLFRYALAVGKELRLTLADPKDRP
jgi:transcriptional regulator with XRE-family HTH domain